MDQFEKVRPRGTAVDNRLELPPVVVIAERDASGRGKFPGPVELVGTLADGVQVDEAIGSDHRNDKVGAADRLDIVEGRLQRVGREVCGVRARYHELAFTEDFADPGRGEPVEPGQLNPDVAHCANLAEDCFEVDGRGLSERIELDGDGDRCIHEYAPAGWWVCWLVGMSGRWNYRRVS